jgi:hypothetical protein
MRTISSFTLLLTIIFAFVLVSCAQVEDQEKTVTKKEVPEAVLKAFNSSYPGASIKEYSEEIEGGQKTYEISCTFEGREIDAVYNPDGSVSGIEEVIAVESLPEVVYQAISKEVSQFSIKLAEKIDKDNETFYEVKILNMQDQKTYELQYSDTGELIGKEVKMSKETDEAEELEEENE